MNSSIKKTILKEAERLGAVECRITSAEPLEDILFLTIWLQNNMHGSMKWFERNPKDRCNPKSLLPNAKSVICLAFKYGKNGLEEDDSKTKNTKKNLARFARGIEYHEYVKAKLKILSQKIRETYPAAKLKMCVDTSPILEKALAARAGIGWIGKNSLLINEKHGSFFVLGEIITDLEIQCDEPVAEKCGTCTKCIKACPTCAIASPYIIDTRRCISFLTIENSPSPPDDLKKYIPEGQYGCDICQLVCPYN